MTHPSPNGKITWWLMGLIGTAFIGLAAAWANSVHASVASIEEKLSPVVQKVAEHEAIRSQTADNMKNFVHIARYEAEIRSLERQLTEIADQQREIQRKLDVIASDLRSRR